MKTQVNNFLTRMSQNVGRIKIMLLSFCLFYASLSYGQDKITLRNGTEMECKVIEIGAYQIKYTTSESPIQYSMIAKSLIFMITYANGAKEVFKEEPSPEPSRETRPAYSVNNRYDSDTADFAKIRQKKFSGPRVGFTMLGPGTNADYLATRNKRSNFVQFGWQFETVLFTAGNTSGLVEFVPLVGGFEQGLFIPSMNILLGIRGGENNLFEFAIGPNFSVGRNYQNQVVPTVGCVLAIGTSFRKDKINFPITLAFVPSVGSTEQVTDAKGQTTTSKYETGWRVSLLVGFNTRKR